MSVQTRIYVIKDRQGEVIALVDTTNKSRALAHIASRRFEAHPASTRDIAALMGSGIQIETPGEDDDGPEERVGGNGESTGAAARN